MPGWAWIVVVIGVPLVLAKVYDWNAKRHGHRPGSGGELPVDWANYQPPLSRGESPMGGGMGGG
jgi:hypothetical protein